MGVLCTAAILLIGVPKIALGVTCAIQFEALLRTALGNQPEIEDVDSTVARVTTLVQSIESNLKAMREAEEGRSKGFIRAELSEKMVGQVQELFDIMKVPAKRVKVNSNLMVRFSPFQTKRIDETVLRISTSDLKEHYPEMARVFSRGATNKPLTLEIGNFKNISRGFYTPGVHRVQMVQSLDSIFDLALGGGYGRGDLWHELSHAFSEKRRFLRMPSRTFDTMILSTSREAKYAYGKQLSVEEVYTFMKTPLWNLKSIRNPSTKVMTRELDYLIGKKYNWWLDVTDEVMTPLRRMLGELSSETHDFIDVRPHYDWDGKENLTFMNNRETMHIYVDPKTQASLQSGSVTTASVVKERLKNINDLADEASGNVRALQSELRDIDSHLRQLAETDPEKCRKELIALYQKHLQFLKKY